MQRFLKKQICVIDGSMGTALEHLGANLNNSLWTARVLLDQPELVKKVHLDYFHAGADAGITCSYQATIPGLMANGLSEKEAEDLIVRSVKVFQEARNEWWEKEGKAADRAYPMCLAGIGPYGAYLADGSEYKGHYGIPDAALHDFHQRRAELCGKPAPMSSFLRPSLPLVKPKLKRPLQSGSALITGSVSLVRMGFISTKATSSGTVLLPSVAAIRV